jgi:hypothetical protein
MSATLERMTERAPIRKYFCPDCERFLFETTAPPTGRTKVYWQCRKWKLVWHSPDGGERSFGVRVLH